MSVLSVLSVSSSLWRTRRVLRLRAAAREEEVDDEEFEDEVGTSRGSGVTATATVAGPSTHPEGPPTPGTFATLLVVRRIVASVGSGGGEVVLSRLLPVAWEKEVEGCVALLVVLVVLVVIFVVKAGTSTGSVCVWLSLLGGVDADAAVRITV